MERPAPVLQAKMTGSFTPGNFSAVLRDGEVCKGHFTVVRSGAIPKNTTADNAQVEGPLSSVWDSVYGPGFYVAHVLGARYYARTVATGTRGTTLKVEIYRPVSVEEGTQVASIKGVARDSAGNTYKVVF
jgi:hypothetical protein